MERDAGAPSRAGGEALSDQNDPSVNANRSPAKMPTSTATFGVSTQASIVFPESLLLKQSARRSEEA